MTTQALSAVSAIPLTVLDGEPRVDSRLIAEQLGVEHESTRKILEQYQADFEEFGVSRFEIGKPPKGTSGGRPEKFYLLNESQSYLLLTYAQNTPQARELKKALVRAFGQLRDQVLESERRARHYAERVVELLEQQLDERPVRYRTRVVLVETFDQGHQLNNEQRERRQQSADINRQIVALHDAGLNCRKIAEAIGMKRAAVYGRLQNLMRKARCAQ